MEDFLHDKWQCIREVAKYFEANKDVVRIE